MGIWWMWKSHNDAANSDTVDTLRAACSRSLRLGGSSSSTDDESGRPLVARIVLGYLLGVYGPTGGGSRLQVSR